MRIGESFERINFRTEPDKRTLSGEIQQMGALRAARYQIELFINQIKSVGGRFRIYYKKIYGYCFGHGIPIHKY